MATAVTEGIRVQVRTVYDTLRSDPARGHFLFNYVVTISNHGTRTVKLLRRHWYITDSLRALREVEGPGVVGETPELEPGSSYTYASACDLRSTLGRMEGSYLMQRSTDGSTFPVRIPAFTLRWPFAAN